MSQLWLCQYALLTYLLISNLFYDSEAKVVPNFFQMKWLKLHLRFYDSL